MEHSSAVFQVSRISIGKLFRSSFTIYKLAIGRFWLSVLALLIPAVVLFLIARLFGAPSFGFFLFISLGVLWLVIAYFWFQGMVVKIIEDVEENGRIVRSIGEMFSSTSAQIPNLFILAAASLGVVYVGYVFLIIPGIIVALKLYVSVPALFVDGQPVFATMSRSAALTRENLWRIFWIQVIVSVLVGLLFLIVVAIMEQDYEIGLVLGLLAGVALIPYLAMFPTMVYFALRETKQS